MKKTPADSAHAQQAEKRKGIGKVIDGENRISKKSSLKKIIRQIISNQKRQAKESQARMTMSHFNKAEIGQLILARLSRHHRGKANAIRRISLLFYLRNFVPDLDDRTMRKIAERIPRVCQHQGGYYIAAELNEVILADIYLSKKIRGLARRIKERRQAYPEFFGKQLELGL